MSFIETGVVCMEAGERRWDQYSVRVLGSVCSLFDPQQWCAPLPKPTLEV